MSVDGVVEGLVVRRHFGADRETEVILEVDRFRDDDLLFNDYIVVVGGLGMMVMRVSLFIVMVMVKLLVMVMLYCSEVAILVRSLLKMVDWALVVLLNQFMSVLMVNWFNHLFVVPLDQIMPVLMMNWFDHLFVVIMMHWCDIFYFVKHRCDILYFVHRSGDVLNLVHRCDILDLVADVLMINWVLMRWCYVLDLVSDVLMFNWVLM